MSLYREALQQDLGAICRLGEQVNALHHEAWPRIFANPTESSEHAPHWQQSIQASKSTTFLCEEASDILGFVTVFEVNDKSPLLQPISYARVGSICVEENHQGAGIGKALMKCAENWASARGLEDLRLHVWDFNQRAMRLYAELGYTVRSHVLGKRLPADA